MRLSKRETILIGLLIIILVAVIPFVFVISPKLNSLIQNDKLLSQMEKQKVSTQKVISEMKTNQEEIKILQGEAKELYELMEQTNSYDISLILSDMMNRHSITPESLVIEPYEAAVKPGAEDNAEAATSEDAYGEPAAADSDDTKNQPALMRTADLYFNGSQGNVEAFLDEITNYNKSVVVSGFTISQGETVTYEAIINFYEFVEPKVQQTEQD